MNRQLTLMISPHDDRGNILLDGAHPARSVTEFEAATNQLKLSRLEQRKHGLAAPIMRPPQTKVGIYLVVRQPPRAPNGVCEAAKQGDTRTYSRLMGNLGMGSLIIIPTSTIILAAGFCRRRIKARKRLQDYIGLGSNHGRLTGLHPENPEWGIRFARERRGISPCRSIFPMH